MDLLGDPLTTRPIQTGWEFSMEPYPSGRFRCVDDPDPQFGNGSVWTRTQTRSDGPEPLLTLDLSLWGLVSESNFAFCWYGVDRLGSHLVSSYHTANYTLYSFWHLISLALAEMLYTHTIGWILMARSYHSFSLSSYAPQTKTALSHRFLL